MAYSLSRLKTYADAVAQSLDLKASVRVGTTAALAAYTASGSGPTKILTADANGALPAIDGVTLVVNDRILVKDQAASHADHGIYYVQQVGDGGTPWILHRAADADGSNDAAAEVTTGLFTYISAGTLNAGGAWVLVTADPIVVDTTLLQFTQFAGTRFGNIMAPENKNEAPSAVPASAAQDTGLTIAVKPATTSAIVVGVNGFIFDVAKDNTEKATRPFYYSGDNGATARATASIVAGDKLYYNGDVTLFALAVSDRISQYYLRSTS